MDDYGERQGAMDAAYEGEFERWFSSLPPAEQDRLRAEGVSGPATDGDRVNGQNPMQTKDAAEKPQSSEEVDFAAAADTLADLLCEQFDLTEGQAAGIVDWHQAQLDSDALAFQATLFQRLIGAFLATSNPRVEAAGLAFAANLAALNGLGSMRQFSRETGISVATVSKSARRWRANLNLPRSPHMKSDAAAEKYSQVQKRNHWRRRNSA